jgi:hypothetical protein
MKLIYQATAEPVHIGDTVPLGNVIYFRRPHKPDAEGKITIQTGKRQVDCREVYVSLIGAEWVEREARA